MEIFQILSNPSLELSFLDSFNDNTSASEVMMLLLQLENNFIDANLSYNLFNAEYNKQGVNATDLSIPSKYSHRLIFIYAKSFVQALDNFQRILKILSTYPTLPNGIPEIENKLLEFFPDLRGVRNSMQHMEDRIRGLDNKNKPLKLQPINDGFINAPNGAYAFDNLHDTKFKTTMSNGYYGEIDISRQSMINLQEIINSVFDLFK
jgi:hypothetical protein